MRCKKPLLGNVLAISKHFKAEAEKKLQANSLIYFRGIQASVRTILVFMPQHCWEFVFQHSREWPDQKQKERERGNVLFSKPWFLQLSE